MGIDQLVTTAATHDHLTFDWGEITWLDSHDLTGTDTLTVGKVTIYAGERNGKHYHPNCDESLYLLSGELKHTIGDESVTLTAGDLIHIPEGERHRATSTGSEDAVAVIVYDTGTREAEFVDADTE
jgi:quercetin dioxygenase-like cupin family protein